MLQEVVQKNLAAVGQGVMDITVGTEIAAAAVVELYRFYHSSAETAVFVAQYNLHESVVGNRDMLHEIPDSRPEPVNGNTE